MQGQTEQLLLAFLVDLLVLEVDLIADGAVLLVDLRVLGHDRPGLAVFGVGEHEIESGRSAEYPLPDELLVLDEVALLAVDVRLQEDEPAVDVALVEQLLDEEEDLVEGQLVGLGLDGFLGLEEFRVLDGEEVMRCHFECEEHKGKAKNGP